jgi:ribosomal protein S18 acetylase RimI-like enzyme
MSPVLPSPDLGLTWRPISADDIDLWHALVSDIEAHDEPIERHDRDDLVEEQTDSPLKDPIRDSLIGVDGDGVACAFGQVTPLPGATMRRVFLWGGVHPKWRGRGVGRELLRWQTERAHESVAEQDGASTGTPWHILVTQEDKRPELGRFYEAAGYSEIRWFHDMVRPLGGEAPPLPAVAVPEGVELAPWTEDLDDAVRLAHNESFAGHWGSQPRDEQFWKSSITQHRAFRRDWSFVLLDPTQPAPDGRPEVAGYLASHAYPQDWEALGYSQGYVSLVGVRPAWRRRGLAPALLSAAMHAHEMDGIESAGLNVDAGNSSGALGLYARLGFRVQQTSVTWGLESPDVSVL